jgi:hypothetical protein
MDTRIPAACIALTLLLPSPGRAEDACRAQSGATTRPLVELYTSEGCDSCPPADRWLSRTFARNDAPAIALAFHVDYWDRLGWKDRFASAAFTERQHRAAEANRAGFVYTPQVLLQGHDFAWRDQQAGSALGAAAQAPARASLSVTAERRGAVVDVHATATIADAALRRGATVGLAYVDGNLVSDVKAGENRGVRLTHDHVVRALFEGGAPDAHGALVTDTTFSVPAEPGRAPAIVAFVQRPRTGDVLQAVELPLSDCP